MEENKRRVRLKISGIVQGVFFRVETRGEARRLGVNGYVRNMPDSTVEVVAEGTPLQIDIFIAWCRKGPDLARVDDLSIKEEEAIGGESGFNIVY